MRHEERFEVFVRRWTGEEVIERAGSQRVAREIARAEATLRRRKVYVRHWATGDMVTFWPDNTGTRSDGLVRLSVSKPANEPHP